MDKVVMWVIVYIVVTWIISIFIVFPSEKGKAVKDVIGGTLQIVLAPTIIIIVVFKGYIKRLFRGYGIKGSADDIRERIDKIRDEYLK